ncbi:unnamed protein product [Bursaphelenchus okinawaensis]|uniref:FAD synthase n=1 Tax=Bursaphelenchus okinawaensis TaxID=465554 RepID=A0A811KAP4_9BILA|nr:unnamed protein product [Bursaphelenchus okinawaensis]CAG9099499.1 unnamed protein product [Bursaphelenchus okinawaensis]
MFWETSAPPDGRFTWTTRPTCGILVIGDEILNGSTTDTNSHFLCSKLHNRGVAVKKITVIGDNVDEIAQEIKIFSGRYDVVLTTGGIGPTHDDRTFEGLGLAFDEALEINKDLFQVVEVFLKKTKLADVDSAVEKFCKIPLSAKLLWGKDGAPQTPDQMSCFPSVQLNNVVCFPGVPKFCRLAYDQVEDTLFPQDETSNFYNEILYLRRNEVYLQENLTKIADNFKSQPHITIGSYPIMDNSYFKTKLVVESSNSDDGQKAMEQLRSEFKEYIVNYDEEAWIDANNKLEKYSRTVSDGFGGRLQRAIEVIDNVLEEYTPEQIAISFNGGKDCTALLHLLRARMDKKHGAGAKIQAFHILCGDEFSEMADFIRDAGRKYNLDTSELNGPMKSGLEQLKQRKPKVIAVFMGSRFTDPNGRYMKTECEFTDAGWPHFLRVCPLLTWHYVDIWRLLRALCVPYCSLYDKGFTSLGDRTKTKPNKVLQVGEGKYLPAYELREDSLERFGRQEGDQTPPL